MNYKEEKKLFFREKIHSINIFLFLGFNLALISILGFMWFNYSVENIVKAFNKKPTIDLRINPLKTDLDKFLKVLHEKKIDAEIIKDNFNIQKI